MKEVLCRFCGKPATVTVMLGDRPQRYCAACAVQVRANIVKADELRRKAVEQMKERYKRNDRMFLLNKEWRRTHLIQNVTHRTNWRAKKMGAKGRFTSEEFQLLCERFAWRCGYCGCPVVDRANEKNTVTPDHVIPLSKGGSNFIWNLIPACWDCNNQKGDRTPREWFTERVNQGLTARPVASGSMPAVPSRGREVPPTRTETNSSRRSGSR